MAPAAIDKRKISGSMIQTPQSPMFFFLSLLGLKKYGMDRILCLIALFVCIFLHVAS